MSQKGAVKMNGNLDEWLELWDAMLSNCTFFEFFLKNVIQVFHI